MMMRNQRHLIDFAAFTCPTGYLKVCISYSLSFGRNQPEDFDLNSSVSISKRYKISKLNFKTLIKTD